MLVDIMYRKSKIVFIFLLFGLVLKGQNFINPALPKGISYSLTTGTSFSSFNNTNINSSYVMPSLTYAVDSSFALSASVSLGNNSFYQQNSAFQGYNFNASYKPFENLLVVGRVYGGNNNIMNNFYNNYYSNVDFGMSVFLSYKLTENITIGGAFNYIKPGSLYFGDGLFTRDYFGNGNSW